VTVLTPRSIPLDVYQTELSKNNFLNSYANNIINNDYNLGKSIGLIAFPGAVLTALGVSISTLNNMIHDRLFVTDPLLNIVETAVNTIDQKENRQLLDSLLNHSDKTFARNPAIIVDDEKGVKFQIEFAKTNLFETENNAASLNLKIFHSRIIKMLNPNEVIITYRNKNAESLLKIYYKDINQNNVLQILPVGEQKKKFLTFLNNSPDFPKTFTEEIQERKSFLQALNTFCRGVPYKKLNSKIGPTICIAAALSFLAPVIFVGYKGYHLSNIVDAQDREMLLKNPNFDNQFLNSSLMTQKPLSSEQEKDYLNLISHLNATPSQNAKVCGSNL